MGLTIPLLIYDLSILIIGIIAIKKTLEMWKQKEIKYRELTFGLIITLTLLSAIITINYKEMSYWSLFFKIPIIMLFIPYLIYHITEMIKMNSYISKLSLINISYTTLGITFYILIGIFLN